MQDGHIIQLLDEKPLTELTGDEIASIASHVAQCPNCKLAYEAARVSGELVEVRSAESIAPDPFFKTRVLAQIRERRLSTEVPALVRLWRAAGAMVSVMLALVAVLGWLTVFAPESYPPSQPATIATAQDVFSAEYVVLDQDDLDDNGLMYDQVMTTIYDSGESDDAQR